MTVLEHLDIVWTMNPTHVDGGGQEEGTMTKHTREARKKTREAAKKKAAAPKKRKKK
jgi:hypothetical protein